MNLTLAILIARMTNDTTFLKVLCLGLTGTGALLSNIHVVASITVALVTMICMIYITRKKGKLIDQQLKANGFNDTNDIE